ncbi:MAG: PD40 domain-containing protein [Verrucomicrobia bacterium]|nr:PD40 domain-containing protein [Verrucomicrobiota bacterium]
MNLSYLVEFTAGLLRVSCQASVVVGLVLLVQWLFQKRLPPRWRYALWTVVLLRLALPVVPGSPFSIFNYTQGLAVLSRHGLDSAGSRSDWPGAASTPTTAAQPSGLEARGTDDSNRKTEARNIEPGARTAPSARIPGGDREAADTAVRAPTDSRSTHATLRTVHVSLAVLWLAGALFLAGRIFSFPRQLNAQLAQHESPAPPALFDVLEQSKRLIGVNRVLPIVQSRAVASPALLGFIRPWLLLPEGMAERFTPQELRLVFLHELAHLKRRDIAVNWLMTLLQVLHWFNPLVWIAFSRIRADRELACDELALSHAPEADRQPYGQTMIKLLESFARPTAIAGLVGILEDKQQMKRRIAMIAEFTKTSRWSALAPAMLLLSLGMSTLTDAQTEKVDGTNKTTVSKSNSELTLRKFADLPVKFWVEDVSHDGRYLLGNTARGTTLRGFNQTTPVMLEIATGDLRRYDAPHALKLSPDGRQVLCGRFKHGISWIEELFLMDIEAGKTRSLYRNEQVQAIWVQDWSPDGQHILVMWTKQEEIPREIALISVADGTARKLDITPQSGNPSQCKFSADGRWVVYDIWPKGSKTSDIHLLAVDGSRDIPLVQHPAGDRLLGCPPGTDQVIFMTDRRGAWDAYSIRISGGNPKSEPALLKEGIGRVTRALGFAANGKFFYITDARLVDVYFAKLNPDSATVEGSPVKAAHLEGQNHYPAWSPDGRFLAYVSSEYLQGGTILIRDITAGTVRELSSDATTLSFPHWSPDGRSLFALSYRAEDSKAVRIELENGKSTELGGESVWYNVWPAWSWTLDGKAYYRQEGNQAIVRRDLETGEKTKTRIPANRWSSALSPDCKLIAFSVTATNSAGTVERTISVAPLSGGESRQLAKLQGPEAIEEIHLYYSTDEGLGWTPDGQNVLFVKGSPNDDRLRSLWRVSAAGGEPKPLGIEMEKLRQPLISPDGRHLAFTAGGTRTEIWVMENFLPPQKTAAK